MCDRADKPFDCVAMMREIRDRLSREIEGMDHDELQAWFRSREYSDPTLARFAKLFTENPKDL